MDVTSNFFIVIIAIFMYFFLIGLVYIKVNNPQYPINWALVMNFMLGLNNYDNFNVNPDAFSTMSQQPSTPIKEGFAAVLTNAGSSVKHKFSQNINWMVDWMGIQMNRLLVKLYISKNTFYSTQRINSRPLVSL